MTLPVTLLCVVFMVWLLIRDSKYRPPLSAATWIPTVVVFTLASRSPGQWLGQTSTLIDQVFFLSTTAASLAILISRKLKWGKLFASNSAIMLFYGYFIVSFLWSNHPTDSLTRVFKDLFTNVVLALVIFSEKNPFEALRAIYVRCACVGIPLSLLFTRYYDLGKQFSKSGIPSFSGVAGQKNSFGQMLMIFILFMLWDHLESQRPNAKWLWNGMRWDRLTLLLMGVWLVHVCQSKTSLVCVLVGLALIRTKGWLTSPTASTAIFCVALSLPFLVLLTQQFGATLTPIFEALGRDPTFTGRTDVWQEINLTTVNPLVGAGFWNFWGAGPVAKTIAEAAGMDVINAHDGYLDLYLDGGLIGLGILFVLLVASAKRIIATSRLSRFHRLRFVFLLITIFGNLTESLYARPSILWFTSVLVMLDYPFSETDLEMKKPGSADRRSQRMRPREDSNEWANTSVPPCQPTKPQVCLSLGQ